MGKGDKKTKKGKIWRGSFGNSRPKAKGTGYKAAASDKVVTEEVEVKAKAKPRKKAAPKKKAADKE